MQPGDLEKIPLQIEKLFLEMQNRVMKDIVRRIKKTGGITSTADYQIQKVIIFGNSTEYIESEIRRLLDATNPEMWELYDKVVEQDYTRNKDIYEQVNRQFIPYEENDVMQTWVKAVAKQTNNELHNITKSLGFSLFYGTKRVFTPLAEYYQKYLDRACLDIVTGAFDYNTVLRRVVKEMTASGIRTVTYASGHSNRVEVAARRAVMTGVHQLTAQINERIANDLDTDTFEVTAHLGARPSHQLWQGRVYNRKELENVCGLGTGAGLCGWNCRHSYFAFIPGVSVRAYTDERLEEMKRIDNEVKTWKGKEYTGYEATQKQRQLETKMRAQRASVKQLKNGKAADEDILSAQAKYVHTLHEYQAFSKKMGLHEQMERVYMDGLGRVAPRDRFIKHAMNDASGIRARTDRTQELGYNRSVSQKAVRARKKIEKSANLMYDTGNKADNVKAYLRDKPIRDKIQSSETKKTLEKGQYLKHVPGSHEYKQYQDVYKRKGQYGPSYLTIPEDEVRKLVDKYAGTGILKRGKDGRWLNEEVVTIHPDDIGIVVNNLNGVEAKTPVFKIKYSKKGVHVIPDYPSKKGAKGK